VTDLLEVAEASRMLNYGLDRVRFTAPVRAGARIRAHAQISDVRETQDGFQVAARVTAEQEGSERPVCVADIQIRYMR
jgi:acyl dehydratase